MTSARHVTSPGRGSLARRGKHVGAAWSHLNCGSRIGLRRLAASVIAGFFAMVFCGGAALASPNFQVIHRFNYANGAYPASLLITDGAGNLYGTTEQGGAKGNGVVFELSPPAAGRTKWTSTVLHSFKNRRGAYLEGGLLMDGAGNLYGGTLAGGPDGDGVVFELSPPPAGRTKWTETILHVFTGGDGQSPWGTLIADSAGNLYGTTWIGGPNGDAVVFELSPPATGQTGWTATVLHAFDGTRGSSSIAGLIMDDAGNLYGVT